MTGADVLASRTTSLLDPRAISRAPRVMASQPSNRQAVAIIARRLGVWRVSASAGGTQGSRAPGRRVSTLGPDASRAYGGSRVGGGVAAVPLEMRARDELEQQHAKAVRLLQLAEHARGSGRTLPVVSVPGAIDVYRGVSAALGWALGLTDVAPVSGRRTSAAPDERELGREWAACDDALHNDQVLRETGRSRLFVSAVENALQWARGYDEGDDVTPPTDWP